MRTGAQCIRLTAGHAREILGDTVGCSGGLNMSRSNGCSICRTPIEATRLRLLKSNTTNLNRMHTISVYEKLHKIHQEHPEFSRADLRMETGASRSIISRYWKEFVVKQEVVLRRWDEVMQ